MLSPADLKADKRANYCGYGYVVLTFEHSPPGHKHMRRLRLNVISYIHKHDFKHKYLKHCQLINGCFYILTDTVGFPFFK